MSGGAALSEFFARVADIEEDLELVSLAARLRPRLGGVLNFQAVGDELTLALAFVAHKGERTEGIFGALLVRLLAAFERFIRRRIAERVVAQASGAKKYDDLPEQLRKRHLVLSGRALGMLDYVPDHLSVDPEALLDGLATCRAGATTFSLNSRAFEIAVSGPTPEGVTKALESVGVEGWTDKVGALPSVAAAVETKATKVRETAKKVEERLRQLSRWRNNLAHAGDAEITVDEDLLRKQLTFLRALGEAIDTLCR